MEKELEKSVQIVTKDITSYIPHNIVEIISGYAFSLLMALLIFVIGKWVVNKVVDVLGTVLRKVKGMDETLIKFLENIVYYALMIIVLLTTLGKLGVETTSFFAILGAAGLAVGLALKDSLKKSEILMELSKFHNSEMIINNIIHQWKLPLSRIISILTNLQAQIYFGKSIEKSVLEERYIS